VEEIFERFNQITKPIEVMSFEGEQLMSNLNYLMLIQSIEDREDDEQRKMKLLQIDELIIPTEGNLSPIAVTLAKELHERELATQMTKLQSTMKELNRQWKFTFYPMLDYSKKIIVESLNKMLITKETSLTS
jgi:hypothetical protein